MLLCFSASAETADFSLAQTNAFETVKWNADFPKDAQLIQAMEYFCKVEGHQLRLMLLEVTQNENLVNIFGNAARLLLVDLETGETVTYANFYETTEVTTKQDALNLLFNHFFSFIEGYNPQIFADHELIFPLSQEEISEVNAALNQHFIR
jgi:hypothetical protein